MNISNISSRVLWSLGEFLAVQIITLLTIVVLARLISPEEYGKIALLAMLIGLATVLVESGLGQALIQNQNIDDLDKSTAFWINMILAVLISFTFIFFSNSISGFYEEALLKDLIPIYALTIIASSIGVVPRALLIKNYRLRAWSVVRVLSSTFSGVIAITLAIQGFGVYSLAFQSLSAMTLTSIFALLAASWRPKTFINYNSARRMYKFSGHLLLSGIIEVLYVRLNTILLGKFYGPETLGYFSRAESISGLISGIVTYPIMQLALPSFSEVSGDIKKLKARFLFALRMSSLVSGVLVFTAASLAEPTVLILLGPDWSQSAPILSILCLATVFLPAHVLNLNALAGIGRTDLYLRVEIIKKAFGIVILLISFSWGVFGLACGYVLYGIVAHFVNSAAVTSFIKIGPFRQIMEMFPGLLIGAVSAGVSFVYTQNTKSEWLFSSLLIGLALSGIIFLFLMVTMYLILGRNRFRRFFQGL